MIPVAPSPHPQLHQWSSNEMLNKMNNNTVGGGCKSTTPSNFNSSQKNMFGVGCCVAHNGTKNSTASCSNRNSPAENDNCSSKNLANLLAASNKSNRVNLSYRISAPVHYFANTSSQKHIDMYMDVSDCEHRCKNQNHHMHHHPHRCVQNQHHLYNNHQRHHQHQLNHHHHHHQAYFNHNLNNNANPLQQPNIIQCGGNANMLDLDSDGGASSDCSYSAVSTSTSGGTAAAAVAKKSRAMIFKRYLKLFQKNPTGTLSGSKKDWNKYLYYNQIMEYFNK